MIDKKKYIVAYLSMEIALENNIKTYSGGLGVLAGDILRSAAGKKFPMVGVTLLNNQGYFKQKISSSGSQIEQIDRDYDFSSLKKLAIETNINIGNDIVKVGVWEYIISGPEDFNIPVYLLDTNILGNKVIYKKITSKLYGGDLEFRLRQELVLGIGGVKILQALGYDNIEKYHLNEGHAAFTAMELFYESKAITDSDKIKEVKKKCVFTTHTPIQTIFDEFPVDLLIKNQINFPLLLPNLIKNKKLNTLNLAMFFSGYINGVAKAHQVLLNNIFPDYNIQGITNGVNSIFWTSDEFKELYDKYIFGWRENISLLMEVNKIPGQDIWFVHQQAKKRLLEYIENTKKINWQEEIFTICFARRFTGYKQPLLLLTDVDRLLEILESGGKMQIIFSGKAHRRDVAGQEAVKKIQKIKKKYSKLSIIFLENYNLDIARLLVAGVDLWLNNPIPPQEACGTSGMKAAHNGVPQISTLDGWWPEGYKAGKTGWTISSADELYETLKKEILPLYYKNPSGWQEIMKNTISLNASYFNSDRTLEQYIKEAYNISSYK